MHDTSLGTQKSHAQQACADSNAVDGIFRAAPAALSGYAGQVICLVAGQWSVILNLAGETFSATFPTAESAMLAAPMLELYSGA